MQLPGALDLGELIYENPPNQPQGYLQFGANPLISRTSVTGAPFTTLRVDVGDLIDTGTVAIDSGGITGVIPPSDQFPLGTRLPPGTTISYYTPDGQTTLFSYTTTDTNSPFVRNQTYVNTGNEPFALGPIYISNSDKGVGTTVFDNPPT